MSRAFLVWVPLVSLLMMIIWGFIGWFGFGVEKAGVLGDSMSPITSLLTAFTLGAALYSLEIQRKELKSRLDMLEKRRDEEQEEKKWLNFISRLEYLDTQHHIASEHCPWCDMLDKARKHL